MTDEIADQARAILAANRYAVIGTASPSGDPWVSPVYFGHRGLGTLMWLSRPSARHSQLIAGNDRIAVTVFDSTAAMGQGSAFYARASAGLCPEAELPIHLEAFSTQSVERGFPAWRLDQVTGDAALRLYRAEVSEAWLLPADDGPERRIPVPPR
jgi:Pyridoxamine 5'-phosphate oxidase